MSDIAKNIKKLRQKKNLTQEELAERLFVTRQAVSNWETGKNQPDVDTLKSLSEVLGVDIKDVIYGSAPDLKRRHRIIAAGILWVLTAAAWGAFVLLYDKAKLMRAAYDLRLSALLLSALRPMAFLLLGAAVPAFISIWKDLSPATDRVRRGLLVIAAAVLLAYILGGLFSYHGHRVVMYYWALWVWNSPWTFLIPGAFLFCGWGRKAG